MSRTTQRMHRLALALSLRDNIKTFPNFPKKGIQFEDVSGLLSNPALCKQALDECVTWARKQTPAITKVAGLESRGFLLGVPIALKLKVPFVMIRKSDKLPGPVWRVVYTKEYGSDSFEVQKEAFGSDDRVLLVDDLLATGGSIVAAARLIKSAGATPVAFSTIVHLTYLSGLSALTKECPDLRVHALLPLTTSGAVDRSCFPVIPVLAFDIGSGTTKASLVLVNKDRLACMADNPDPEMVEDILLSKQVDILVGVDYQVNGHISDFTQAKLLAVINAFLQEAKAVAKDKGHDWIHVTGIATAVFRDAQNADLFSRMNQAVCSTLQCVNAREEARLGWTTAMLLKPQSTNDLSDEELRCLTSRAVWDLGGGSSQLSVFPDPASGAVHGTTKLQLECVNVGSSQAVKALDVIKANADAQDSPVTYDQACQLITELHKTFRRGLSDALHLPPDHVLGPWTCSPKHVMCIGGPTSAFAAIQTVLRGFSSQPASVMFTQDDVLKAITRVTDAGLDVSMSCDAEVPSQNLGPEELHFMLVPKLCLVLAGMRAMSIEGAYFMPSNGSTLALAIDYVAQSYECGTESD